MSVTAILIEPRGVTRVFFDGDDLAVGDQLRIAQAIECSLGQADGDTASDNQRRLSAGPHQRIMAISDPFNSIHMAWVVPSPRRPAATMATARGRRTSDE